MQRSTHRHRPHHALDPSAAPGQHSNKTRTHPDTAWCAVPPAGALPDPHGHRTRRPQRYQRQTGRRPRLRGAAVGCRRRQPLWRRGARSGTPPANEHPVPASRERRCGPGRSRTTRWRSPLESGFSTSSIAPMRGLGLRAVSPRRSSGATCVREGRRGSGQDSTPPLFAVRAAKRTGLFIHRACCRRGSPDRRHLLLRC